MFQTTNQYIYIYYLNLYMPLFLVDDIYQRVIFPRLFPTAGPLVLVTLALRFPGTAWLVGLVAMFGSEELPSGYVKIAIENGHLWWIFH